MQADRIELRGLRVLGTHGVHQAERSAPQPFEVDLDIHLDTSAAAASDDLADTADYAAAVDMVAAVMAGPPRRLLESLAGAIAARILGDPRVSEVTVGVRKLRPPVPHDLGSAGVRVTRSRSAERSSQR
ncbi:MAG TPA: dihydroneopterin aldolase [Acidimicrobiales bacterium]|nr:dihydroneopterin aldolase [Acidimicrobiales bacterium]